MPRKLRIQRPGALYHVINRGNYRSDLFASEGASQAFLTALFEAASQYAWRLHAYVLMRNHYHLALETPMPNLVEGMHWLQGTFSNRFNRLCKQNGHVFQGRYKAILLEDMRVLSRVVDYIHLNPVRAGVVTAGQVEQFRWSSLAHFLRRGRPAQLACSGWLMERGGWHDNASGLRGYLRYLHGIGNDEQEQKKAGLAKLSRGWALGTHGWKQALAREHAHKVFREGMEAGEIREMKQLHWEDALAVALKAAGRAPGNSTPSHACSTGNSKSPASSAGKQAPRSHGWRKNFTWENPQLPAIISTITKRIIRNLTRLPCRAHDGCWFF